MSERRHYALLGATVLIVLLFGLFVLRPRASQAADLRAQVAEAQAQNRVLNDQLSTLLDASVKRKDFEAKVAKVEALLPRFPHLVRTFRLLPKAALTAGVDLREIAPSPPTDHLTVGKAKTIVVTLVAEGSYDRIESFIRGIENLERAMQITAYSFTPQVDGSQTSISAAITTEMYLYDPAATDPNAPAAPPVPAPGTEGATQ